MLTLENRPGRRRVGTCDEEGKSDQLVWAWLDSGEIDALEDDNAGTQQELVDRKAVLIAIKGSTER